MKMAKRYCPVCGAEQPEGGGRKCVYCNSRIEEGAKVSWGWVEAILGFTASILLLFLFQNLLYLIGLSIMIFTSPFSLLRLQLTLNILTMRYELDVNLTTPPELLSFVTLGELALLIVPLLYLKLRKIPLRELGFNFKDRRATIIDLAVGCLAGVGMMITANILSTITSIALLAVLQALYGPIYGVLLLLLAEEFISEVNAPFVATSLAQLILLVASVTLLVAPCEEIATRGFLQQGLEKSWGRWKGLAAAAVIFSVLHVIFYPQGSSSMGLPGVGIVSVLLALPTYIILSLILGALLQARDYRIVTTIAAHASYMAILVIMLSV
ncbi:MAG: CPBP family intramembrane metalloprotease [Candidatus Freyarchaeota archaeon]|nr:CPBP family intramembrane metalloprotease [Candidatus Jordarchaeia archaeon]